MNVGVAHSEDNPNCSWLSQRGGWISYCIGVLALYVLVWAMPFVKDDYVWTCTNTIHNVFMYLIMHQLKGAPWLTTDQGESRRLTYWEQIDSGQQMTDTRKFFTIFPAVLFLITSYATNYAFVPFLINTATLMLVLLPKLPQFHKVRVFDLNKY